MLKKVLSLETCAECRNCCVFYEESRWETPIVSKEKAGKIIEKLNDRSSVIPVKNSYTLASVKREADIAKGVEPYKCVALNEESGCSLSADEKPFDCSLWPVRIMEKETKVYIMLAKGCKTVDSVFVEKVKKLLMEGLKAQILIEVRKNPDIIKSYSDNYIMLCEITDEI